MIKARTLPASKGFSLVEILVVVTIISMLASIAAVSYSRFVKQGRDSRRRSDIEQIRAASEMYRNFKGTYPTTMIFTGSGQIVDGATQYMTKVPSDPSYLSTPSYTYYYSSVSPFLDYIICAYLEGGSTTSITAVCGAENCNYCMGPYGQE